MHDTDRSQWAYLLGSAVVWAAIVLATAVILRGTEYFSQMLPVLGGGAAWFVVIAPAALFARRGRSR